MQNLPASTTNIPILRARSLAAVRYLFPISFSSPLHDSLIPGATSSSNAHLQRLIDCIMIQEGVLGMGPTTWEFPTNFPYHQFFCSWGNPLNFLPSRNTSFWMFDRAYARHVDMQLLVVRVYWWGCVAILIYTSRILCTNYSLCY